jgi:hypothetical protein
MDAFSTLAACSRVICASYCSGRTGGRYFERRALSKQPNGINSRKPFRSLINLQRDCFGSPMGLSSTSPRSFKGAPRAHRALSTRRYKVQIMLLLGSTTRYNVRRQTFAKTVIAIKSTSVISRLVIQELNYLKSM